MKETIITLTMSVRVHDAAAFVHAARERAITEKACKNWREASREYSASKLGACAVMLLDPGISPPGAEILESNTECHHA